MEGEVIGTLETFLHTQGPKTVTFVERPPIWPVLDAWIMMLALAQHYGVGLIEVVDPDKRFPPERRPAPAGTHHIEVRG